MKLSEILSLRTIFIKLMNDPISGCYRPFYQIAKFLHSTDSEAEFYQKEYQKIIELYAEKDEKNKPIETENGDIKIKFEDRQKCLEAIKNLEIIEVDDFYKIKFKNEDLEKMNLTLNQIYNLLPFIEEE